MDALAKIIAQAIAKQSGAVLTQRETEMLIEFHVQGSAVVRKGQDYESVINAAVPYEKLLAVALSKLNGVTVESIVKEALSSELSTSDIKEQAQVAIAKFKGQSSKVCSGKLTVKADVLEVAEIEICENC